MRLTIPIFAAALLFLGAGCVQQGVDAPIDAVDTSLGALQKAKDLANESLYRARRATDATANELPVAMIVTDGHDVPDGAEEVGDVIGCNDTVAWVRAPRSAGTDSVASDALDSLFAVKDTTFKGFHNSLAESVGLKVDRVSLVGDGMVEVNVIGTPVSAGACDTPRIKAQIEQTVLHYHPAVRVLLNGSEAEWRCLGDESGTCS